MRSLYLVGPVFVGSLCALAACVDPGKPKEIDPAYIQSNLFAEPPAKFTNSVNADIGGKVVYLGNDVAVDTVAPGDKVAVTHYWKVIEPPGERWRIFVHLQGEQATDWANIDYSDMRVGYGPDKWQPGDIIRDPQEFQVPKTWSSKFVDVRVGMFPRGGQTAADRMPIVSGPSDNESRVKALRLRIGTGTASGAGKAAKPDKPNRYVVHKAPSAIAIDGRADEAAWQKVPWSPVFVSAEGGPAASGKTKARLLWDNAHLYVFVTAEDRDVFSPYRKQDDPMWREDVIEVFIDADRNRRGYIELQVNPNNAHFDAWFASTRNGTTDKAWNAAMKSAVAIRGTQDNRGDADKGWDVEIAIPLAAVKGRDDAMKVAIPPRVGDTWRLNVVHLNKSESNDLVATSWNRITYQDFHALDRMLTVSFGDAVPDPAAASGQAAPLQPKTAPTKASPAGTAPQGSATKPGGN